MLRNLYFSISFLFIIQSLVAQSNFISTGLMVNRMDYYHSFNFSKLVQKWEFGAGVSYGMKRSLFQHRLFPRFQLNADYRSLQKNKWSLQPTVAVAFSLLKINQTTNHFTNWTETLGGFSWFYGDKWAIGQTFLLGYQFENYFNSISNQRQTIGIWSYSIDLKVRYAF